MCDNGDNIAAKIPCIPIIRLRTKVINTEF